jgi:hypothetical protein
MTRMEGPTATMAFFFLPRPRPGPGSGRSDHLGRAPDEIGYASVDLGPLSEGWRTQPDTAAYGVMYAVDPQAWDQGSRRQRPGMSRQ